MDMMSRRPYRVSFETALDGEPRAIKDSGHLAAVLPRTPKIDGVPIGPRRKHVPSNINIR